MGTFFQAILPEVVPCSAVCHGAVCASCGQLRQQRAFLALSLLLLEALDHRRVVECSHYISMVGREQTVGCKQSGTFCHLYGMDTFSGSGMFDGSPGTS